MVSFRVITSKEFEALPESKPAKGPNQWDEVVGTLESGKAVMLDVPADKVRGTRIGIARLAASREIKLDFRYQDGRMGIRKSSKPFVRKAPTERKPRTPKE